MGFIFHFYVLNAYGSASFFPLAILSLGIGFNFPLWGEAEIGVELNKLESVQLQLQLQRQGLFPPSDGEACGLVSFPPLGLEASVLASSSSLAIWSLGVGFNFPPWGEAEAELNVILLALGPANWLPFSLCRFRA
jgi:hypothetical protein